MIIIGAGGFAREVLEIVYRQYGKEDICFYDDYTAGGPRLLYDTFPVITSLEAAAGYFQKNSAQFVLGLGNPLNRYAMYRKFIGIGGAPFSIISDDARIGSF